ncbi:hypothetical protein M426DRAFT_323849 [Hypoxylon sp. CI-4A]|nr:hypothetical protein M426DRAFT_323849 [Hypoxylon sp. CI-4A]
MAEKDMRLRLVVRRDGLPEERLMWNISLENEPTISILLEKVNEILPLEIEQCGLENYVVELHDDDGTTFECLHFQPIRNILKPNDRVYIRALSRDDNRRRRISGRYQISADGRHLIDGIAFGRRLLKTPNTRPPVSLPPRKRARIAYNYGDDNDDDGDFADEEDTSMLLLTNGDKSEGMAGPAGVKKKVVFNDANVDANVDAEDDEFNTNADQEDIGDESESDDSSQGDSEIPSDEEGLEDELRDLAEDSAAVENENEPGQENTNAQASDGDDDDDLIALRAAFPMAPKALCAKILATSNGDLNVAYSSLTDAFKPKLSKSTLPSSPTVKGRSLRKSKRHQDQDQMPTEATSSKRAKEDQRSKEQDDENPHNLSNNGEEEEEEEEEEQVSSFVRQYDHRGLPPGSITSGRGLAQMAAISGSFISNGKGGESETTSATLNGSKISPEKTVEENEEAQSDGTSSSSEGEDSESDSDSDSEGTSSNNDDSDDDDEHNDDSEDDGQRESGNNQSLDSDSEDENSDDSSEGSDSGPEEKSTRRSEACIQQNPGQEANSSDVSDTSSSEESSDDDSSEDSSDESGSESGSEPVEEEPSLNRTPTVKSHITEETAKSAQQVILPRTKKTVPQVEPVPPGAGKESTKKRNLRRRAAKAAKKLGQENTVITNSPSTNEQAQSSAPIDEKALFEAKRQELLDAIANGGIEVGPSSQVEDSTSLSTATKRKRNDQTEITQQNSLETNPTETPASEDVHSSGSAQKKRRVDVGAGRRLLFGALGVRNPQTKKDEDDLREKFMENVRPHENPRLEKENTAPQQENEEDGEIEEGLDSWQDKIAYRAVECYDEDVDLSEPPFPFVQRWDPQQQGSWYHKKNKRGGQGKRAQRNEVHFYEESRSSKKRKHDESEIWDEEGYDVTFNGIEDDTNADVQLEYDDPKDEGHNDASEPMNDASQFTDMDDLPSLPSDLSTLPILRPGEVQIGMVITWQQWSCSSATSWQPQLSSVTGVVVRIDDDATGLEVCLAKRDRYLDRNEKKYDERTGQRIYDKFEAPDLDEDEDEDEDEGEDDGFRTMSFAEMQQPRILQQPLPTMLLDGEPHGDANQPAEANPRDGIDQSMITGEMAVGTSKQSNPEEPSKDTTGVANTITSQSTEEQQTNDASVSGLSGISSPSRQLHESASQAVSAGPHSQSTQDAPSRSDAIHENPSNKPIADVTGTSLPSVRQSSTAPLFDSLEDEVVTGTPKVIRSKLIVPPSSASSARSGRQPDYAVTDPDSSRLVDDGTSSAVDAGGQHNSDSEEAEATPTPNPISTSEPAVSQDETTTGFVQPSSPVPSTPSSLSSVNTVWCTARTSRNTQSPSKSQSQSQSLPIKASQKSQVFKDREYDEAMRKLENPSDEQESFSKVTDSFKRSSQLPGLNGTSEYSSSFPIARRRSPPIKISPPPTRRRKSPKSSQFTLPPGTQVVELSSDSEEAYTENYADEEVDKTYTPETDSFPRGNGWVHKTLGKGNSMRRATAPVRTQSGKKKPFISSSQPSSMSSFSPIKPRRKTSSRF